MFNFFTLDVFWNLKKKKKFQMTYLVQTFS